MNLRAVPVLAALACAGPLAAQAVPIGPRLMRVAASSGGVVLSVDSTTLARTADSTFMVDVVYQLPADTAQRVGADRQVESQEMDCARTRVRGRRTAFYVGETPAQASTPATEPREWQPVGDDELPIFQAVCGYLLAAPFAAALPVTRELGSVDRAPELANRSAVRHALTAEYPPDLRSAGVTGTTQVRFLVTAEGGVDGATARALWATRPELAAAAVRVVQAMRFRPAQQDGAAVPVWVALPVTFMVPGSQGPPPAADPAARAVPRGPTLLRVATLPDGVALSLDSAAVARTGDSTFVVATVYQRGGRADGRVESLAMDCAGTRVRGRHTLYYGGDVARSATEPGAPRGWQPVAEGERPVFQALCGYLLGSFAASLPVTLEAVAAEEEPELSNRFEVAQLLSRAYPRRLRDAGTGGSVLLRLLITADGRVAPAEARVLWATRHEFAAAALVVARQMRFTPARTGGRGVASWVTLPMSFSIDGEELPRPPGPPRGSGAPTLPPRP